MHVPFAVGDRVTRLPVHVTEGADPAVCAVQRAVRRQTGAHFICSH